MNEEADRNLRNAIVFALADGELAGPEMEFIQKLRRSLGVPAERFNEICDEVRSNSKKMSVPRGSQQAQETLAILAKVALADGQVSPAERSLLQKIAGHMGFPPGRVDALLSSAAGGQGAPAGLIERLVAEMYSQFASWDDQQRRAKIDELGRFGGDSAPALIRVLESYRRPDGMPDALALKTMIARKLGELGDLRAVYYLAQQVTLGDVEDEISSKSLRAAAAEAIGKLVGKNFQPDESGVREACDWWTSPDSDEYDTPPM